jgi:hypothetical protein
MGKKSKINWENVVIRLVPPDRDNPNGQNPYVNLSPKEREKSIISTSARIWSRHIRSLLSLNQDSSSADQRLPGGNRGAVASGNIE